MKHHKMLRSFDGTSQSTSSRAFDKKHTRAMEEDPARLDSDRPVSTSRRQSASSTQNRSIRNYSVRSRSSRSKGSIRSRLPSKKSTRNRSGLHKTPSASWVLKNYKDNLIIELKPPRSPIFDRFRNFWGGAKATYPEKAQGNIARRFRISFAQLQSMHLRKLQYELIRRVVDMRF